MPAVAEVFFLVLLFEREARFCEIPLLGNLPDFLLASRLLDIVLLASCDVCTPGIVGAFLVWERIVIFLEVMILVFLLALSDDRFFGVLEPTRPDPLPIP